jgi:protein-L-isoaspartate(D-aspartate) O-methyltransferase
MDGPAALADQLRATVMDDRVLGAIASLPRERFVPAGERDRSYENRALPIACDQTISQPLVVARMLEALALAPTDRVLDIGTGSGYHAALLALLSSHVWTVERHAELSAGAREAIAAVGIANVSFVVGDGYEGLPEQAPFEAINVAAAVPETVPVMLEDQLAPGGRMVVPVGGEEQYLMLARRTATGIERERLDPVRFVPLVRGAAPGPRRAGGR